MFWNSKLHIYEKFTLKVYKVVENKDETLNGFWTGEYDEQAEFREYGEFFDFIAATHLEPVLILWERISVINVEVSQSKYTGKQQVEYIGTIKAKDYEDTEEDYGKSFKKHYKNYILPKLSKIMI